MARNLGIEAHLRAMARYFRSLKRETGTLKILENPQANVYVRISGKGFRLLSLNDKTPLDGLGPTVDTPGKLARHLNGNSARNEESKPGVERRVQAWVIRRALNADGDLRRVLRISASEYSDLQFAFDEVSPKSDIRCDIIAVGHRNGRYVPVVIELKWRRSKTELIKQINSFCGVIQDNQEPFSELLHERTGKHVDCSAPGKVLVWPALNGRDLRGTSEQLAQANILEITYRLNPSESIESIQFRPEI